MNKGPVKKIKKQAEISGFSELLDLVSALRFSVGSGKYEIFIGGDNHENY